MIISQTPLRISFFGGGTDYPEYFRTEGGAVLGTAIDKSSFLSATPIYSRLFDYSIQVSYRRTECVRSLEEIEHAPYRECLRRCGIDRDIEVGYFSELPAFSGLGASSTFVVGLLNALYAVRGKFLPPLDLAREAIELERDVLHEAVGCQDQAFAALGGFNLLEFHGDYQINVYRIPLSVQRLNEFERHLLLFHTGIQRRAHDMAARQIGNVESNRPRLRRIRKMVDEGLVCVTAQGSLERFGKLLQQTWELKSELAEGVSGQRINEIHAAGMEAGAWGAKLLGAGGGGFILFCAPPERHEAIRQALSSLQEIEISLNAAGSRIIHASPMRRSFRAESAIRPVSNSTVNAMQALEPAGSP